MNNFVKYYSYFISEYIIKDLYNEFAPNDNMISSGVNMMSYIAELGSDGHVKCVSVEDMYVAITKLIKALFHGSEQYFITKDRTIIKIDGLDFDDILKLNDMIVSGVDSDDLLYQLNSGDLWYKFEVVDVDGINGVGSRCFQNIYTNSKFVGVIPQVDGFIEKVRENLKNGYHIDIAVEEQYLEEGIFSALDYV